MSIAFDVLVNVGAVPPEGHLKAENSHFLVMQLQIIEANNEEHSRGESAK